MAPGRPHTVTAVNGSNGNRRDAIVSSPDPTPPALKVKPPLVERNGWSWVNREGADARLLSGLLDEFVDYFNARYAWTTDHLIPPCWALHGALVEELTTLMWSRWAAFESTDATPVAAVTWHTYYLPGFLTRVNMWLGNHTAAECRSGNHRSSSIRGRDRAGTGRADTARPSHDRRPLRPGAGPELES